MEKGIQGTCVFVHEASGSVLETFTSLISLNSSNSKGR